MISPFHFMKKQKELSDTKSEEHTQTRMPSDRGPVWDDVSNRVKVAIWKHPYVDRKNPEMDAWRFTTAICRSYVDKEDGKWHNVHFYDKRDLQDVIKAAQLALEQIDRLEERLVP
jgi:hypothetical protein